MSNFASRPDPTIRLRIATRIHFALLRHCGESVAVSTLLQGGDEMREALWVCEASGHAELAALALTFARLTPGAGAAPERAAPQDAAWAQDTSGFGLSRPADFNPPAIRPAASSGWLNPASWLRRGAAR